jgi:hypothetical protein
MIEISFVFFDSEMDHKGREGKLIAPSAFLLVLLQDGFLSLIFIFITLFSSIFDADEIYSSYLP